MYLISAECGINNEGEVNQMNYLVNAAVSPEVDCPGLCECQSRGGCYDYDECFDLNWGCRLNCTYDNGCNQMRPDKTGSNL